MQPLNLPTYNPRLSKGKGNMLIFDPLRQKYVALTPEEWVRQHFVNFLISELRYPAARIANEVALNVNGTAKRCDTVVYDKYLNAIAIVEYKAPQVKITQQVFEQISRYNSALRVPYLIVSNGLSHYCCKIDYNMLQFQFLKNIPRYEEITR